MSQAQKGNTVKVHFTGKLDNGKVFDSSKGKDPMEFKIGDGNVIQGLEKAVIGMKEGDTKTATIPAEEAYGLYRKELVAEVDKDRLPDNIEPKIGKLLKVKPTDSEVITVTISKIDKEIVTLDANHPLAGKTLTFDLNLVEVL
jgi:FKBP-type peptidyl-prolyl cis-trans isomerase 2